MFIVGENELSVAGPASSRTVKSLTLGGEGSASATFNILGATVFTAINGTTIRPNGVLSGASGGVLQSDVVSNGSIRPGGAGPGSVGTLQVDGSVELQPESVLEVDITGINSSDLLVALGELKLGGELAVNFANVDPSEGLLWQVATSFGGMNGKFDMTVTDLPGLSPGLGWLVRYEPAAVVLQIVAAVAGDYDSNGSVGPEDFVVWKANYGMAHRWADGNGDGVVNAADYTVWRDHLGSGGGQSLSKLTSAPEPNVATLLLSAALLISGGSGRRGARRQAK